RLASAGFRQMSRLRSRKSDAAVRIQDGLLAFDPAFEKVPHHRTRNARRLVVGQDAEQYSTVSRRQVVNQIIAFFREVGMMSLGVETIEFFWLGLSESDCSSRTCL